MCVDIVQLSGSGAPAEDRRGIVWRCYSSVFPFGSFVIFSLNS